ncbi:hypothetical protein PRIPAC_83871 [Pristionchus pacificus]|uniref:Uncharacterized protein n=1 Tax=Pristionchus pacificus TaxID=54126 RepID=A0A2A6BS79_PRIPA|nr:hypothetical protein PRIPAC_83871 [Pristionchus pacificus]|eukprot:PDM68738.1 hypothetical protein PRIPAC_47040 [Pristionchus pacificus]
MRPAGQGWLHLPGKKSIFRRDTGLYPPSTEIPYTPKPVWTDGITVEELNAQRERKLAEEKEIDEPPQATAEEMEKRIEELEKLLTESLKRNIKLEMELEEKSRDAEKYRNIVTQMRSVLDKTE